jgi:hypothetical protein
MRRYLESKKELPKQSLVALAPVNTREEVGERQTSGNAISLLTFPLASDIADPIARLAKIQQATAQTKAMSKAIGGHDLTDISKHAPPATLVFAGRLASLTALGGRGPVVLHNCIVTNVPGPSVELTMLGAKFAYLSGVAPIADGVGAIFAVTSFGGHMSISLTSCPEMVPDPAFFGDCIRASVAEMEAAASARISSLAEAGKKVKQAPARRTTPGNGRRNGKAIVAVQREKSSKRLSRSRAHAAAAAKTA